MSTTPKSYSEFLALETQEKQRLVGPKPWAREDTPESDLEIEKHDGEDSFQHYIDFMKQLEKRTRHSESILREIANECCGCSFGGCLHERAREHLQATPDGWR